MLASIGKRFRARFAGDWQSDSLLHRLLEDQKRRSMIILHKEILDFAGRYASQPSGRLAVLPRATGG